MKTIITFIVAVILLVLHHFSPLQLNVFLYFVLLYFVIMISIIKVVLVFVTKSQKAFYALFFMGIFMMLACFKYFEYSLQQPYWETSEVEYELKSFPFRTFESQHLVNGFDSRKVLNTKIFFGVSWINKVDSLPVYNVWVPVSKN